MSDVIPDVFYMLPAAVLEEPDELILKLLTLNGVDSAQQPLFRMTTKELIDNYQGSPLKPDIASFYDSVLEESEIGILTVSDSLSYFTEELAQPLLLLMLQLTF